jgi:hypothetical protein
MGDAGELLEMAKCRRERDFAGFRHACKVIDYGAELKERNPLQLVLHELAQGESLNADEQLLPVFGARRAVAASDANSPEYCVLPE